jgi:iron complex outermembrane receptor protein
MDQGTGYKDCGFEGGTGGYSPSGCRVDNYTTFDLQAAFKVNDQFTFTLTAINVTDNLPPVDIVTYGAYLYNPVQGGTGILGRYFKAGVRAKF